MFAGIFAKPLESAMLNMILQNLSGKSDQQILGHKRLISYH